MLASILPGLRQIRAPLAAGYLWLVVAWVALERSVPERDAADGVLASFYRASDLLSAIGVGVALSFAAYLLGSLSAGGMTQVLRLSFPRAWHGSSDRFRTEPGGPRTPLSPQASAALRQIVRASQDKLISSLALTSGWDLDRFLEEKLVTEGRGSVPHARSRTEGLGRWLSVRVSRLRFRRRYQRPELIGPGSAEPVDIEVQRASQLARAVLDDLDVVANTRLLGRDQELYAEVDRNRAEVEFRLAIIPPIVALAAAVGARGGLVALLVMLPIGVLFASALLNDAVRSEKAANQILLQAIADRRVHAPTLERLETAAAALASQQQPELMSAAASDLVVALQAALGSLEHVGRSEPSLAGYARRQVDVAKGPLTQVSRLFPAHVAHTAAEALALLTEVADGWVATMEGHGPPSTDPHEALARAQDRIAEFQTQVRQAVQESEAAASSPTGGEPEEKS